VRECGQIDEDDLSSAQICANRPPNRSGTEGPAFWHRHMPVGNVSERTPADRQQHAAERRQQHVRKTPEQQAPAVMPIVTSICWVHSSGAGCGWAQVDARHVLTVAGISTSCIATRPPTPPGRRNKVERMAIAHYSLRSACSVIASCLCVALVGGNPFTHGG
jgi:hypothetical protein